MSENEDVFVSVYVLPWAPGALFSSAVFMPNWSPVACSVLLCDQIVSFLT